MRDGDQLFGRLWIFIAVEANDHQPRIVGKLRAQLVEFMQFPQYLRANSWSKN